MEISPRDVDDHPARDDDRSQRAPSQDDRPMWTEETVDQFDDWHRDTFAEWLSAGGYEPRSSS